MSGGTLFDIRVNDLSTPWLKLLARNFPAEYDRALRHLGWWFKERTQEAMRSGGTTIGQNWAERSLVTRYRRLTLVKQGKFSARLGRWTKSKKLTLSRGGSLDFSSGKGGEPLDEKPFGGKLVAAVRWKQKPDQVQIGFLSKSAAAFASAVQDARRGGRFRFTSQGSQSVGSNMRRLFWGAGIPLARSTSSLRQERRPLVKPVFDHFKSEIPRRIDARMRAYILGLRGEAATAYVRETHGGSTA